MYVHTCINLTITDIVIICRVVDGIYRNDTKQRPFFLFNYKKKVINMGTFLKVFLVRYFFSYIALFVVNVEFYLQA